LADFEGLDARYKAHGLVKTYLNHEQARQSITNAVYSTDLPHSQFYLDTDKVRAIRLLQTIPAPQTTAVEEDTSQGSATT